jgi:hypothetical protein
MGNGTHVATQMNKHDRKLIKAKLFHEDTIRKINAHQTEGDLPMKQQSK